MIGISTGRADGFARWASRVVKGSVFLCEPSAVHLVEVDHWFDRKWLRFSGKSLGAVAWWKDDLTVPPFHPNRVRRERHYRRAAGRPAYRLVKDGPRLHTEQPSSHNLQRRMRLLAPDTACFWYSGDASKVGRGALMAYIPNGTNWTAWYIGAVAGGSVWLPKQRVGITPSELAQFEAACRSRAVEQPDAADEVGALRGGSRRPRS